MMRQIRVGEGLWGGKVIGPKGRTGGWIKVLGVGRGGLWRRQAAFDSFNKQFRFYS